MQTESIFTAINVIKNENTGYNTKRVKLIGLGICPREVQCLLDMWGVSRPQSNSTPTNYTFGVELEVVGVTSRDRMIAEANARGLRAAYEGYNHRDNTSYYKFVSDASIAGAGAIECVSPILKSRKDGYDSIKAICTALQQAGAYVNRSTGYHVHVGGDITPEQYVNVFKNYYYLTTTIESFMAPSRIACHWCERVPSSIIRARTIGDVLLHMPSRYFAVNPRAWHVHHTIEFRQHQGTVNATKILAWAKFCIKLVAWSRDHVLTEFVDSIDDIPFITAKEKRYFKSRMQRFVQS